MPENAIGSADTVKYFVYIPSYIDCLLASSILTSLADSQHN
jgi:hypothetical protein